MGLNHIPHQGRSFLGVTKLFVTSGARSNKQTNKQRLASYLIILYLRSKSDRTSMTIPNSNRENQTSIGDFITVMVRDISLDL